MRETVINLQSQLKRSAPDTTLQNCVLPVVDATEVNLSSQLILDATDYIL